MTQSTHEQLDVAIKRRAEARGISEGAAACAVMMDLIVQMPGLPASLQHARDAAHRRWISNDSPFEPLEPLRIECWEFLRAKGTGTSDVTDEEDATVRALICVLWDDGITSADDYDMTLDFFAHLMSRFDSLELPEGETPPDGVSLMSSIDLHRCRVCGLRFPDPPWGVDGRSPTYEFCPCCGVEFGYGDATPVAARRTREAWLHRGAEWSEPGERPCGWNVDEQLADVPTDFR